VADDAGNDRFFAAAERTGHARFDLPARLHRGAPARCVGRNGREPRPLHLCRGRSVL
jgi:hypothetical protein